MTNNKSPYPFWSGFRNWLSKQSLFVNLLLVSVVMWVLLGLYAVLVDRTQSGLDMSFIMWVAVMLEISFFRSRSETITGRHWLQNFYIRVLFFSLFYWLIVGGYILLRHQANATYVLIVWIGFLVGNWFGKR